MRWWRNLRLCGLHLLTWAVMIGGVVVAVLGQLDADVWDRFVAWCGWPMMIRVGSIMNWGEWRWQGVAFNFSFFATIVAASAFVCERLIRSWHKPWQISLAAILWVSSAIGATLAIEQQPYLPLMFVVFEFLQLTPRSERDLQWYVLLPTYVGLACLLYLSADTLLRLSIRLFHRRKCEVPNRADDAVKELMGRSA